MTDDNIMQLHPDPIESPTMTDTPSLPAAQECWGLFDASGAFQMLALPPIENAWWRPLADKCGWTIRRVRVEPVEDKP